MPIPFNMHHGVLGGTLSCTLKVSQTLTTAVVSPGKPKAQFQTGPITTNSTSISHPVDVKLETALTYLDGEPVKSGKKLKTGGNKV